MLQAEALDIRAAIRRHNAGAAKPQAQPTIVSDDGEDYAVESVPRVFADELSSRRAFITLPESALLCANEFYEGLSMDGPLAQIRWQLALFHGIYEFSLEDFESHAPDDDDD